MSRVDLKRALTRARDAGAEVQRINQALEGVNATIVAEGDDQHKLERARCAFEDARAAALVGEAAEQDVANAQRALQDAEAAHASHQQARSQAESLAAGLRRRLLAAEESHKSALAAYEQAVTDWAHHQISAADAEYVKHGQQAAAAAIRIRAAQSFLHARGVTVHASRLSNGDRVELPPLADESLRATVEAHPRLAHGGNAWEEQIFRRPDPLAAAAAIRAEVEAESGISSAIAVAEDRPGLLGAVARVARRVTG